MKASWHSGNAPQTTGQGSTRPCPTTLYIRRLRRTKSKAGMGGPGSSGCNLYEHPIIWFFQEYCNYRRGVAGRRSRPRFVVCDRWTARLLLGTGWLRWFWSWIAIRNHRWKCCRSTVQPATTATPRGTPLSSLSQNESQVSSLILISLLMQKLPLDSI